MVYPLSTFTSIQWEETSTLPSGNAESASSNGYSNYTTILCQCQIFFLSSTQTPSTSHKLKHGDLTGER